MSRKYSRRKLKKDIICYFLSFGLMLSLITLSLSALGYYSLLSVHGVTHTAERVDYYDYLKSEMMQQAYDMAIPYGVDEIVTVYNNKKDATKTEVTTSEETLAEETTQIKQVTKSNVEIEGIVFLDEVFSVDKIQSDVENNLKAKVYGKEFTIKTDEMEKKLLETVQKSKKDLTDEEKESLNAYSAQVMEVYKSKIPLPTLPIIVKGINVFSKIIWFTIPISILVGLLCIFAIMSMRTETYRGLRFVAYGVLGAGITLTTVCAAMISNGSIYRLNISNAYMRRFFTYLLGHEMLMQVFAGVVMLVCGGIMVYAIARIKFRGRV
jgi:hypothetical protein